MAKTLRSHLENSLEKFQAFPTALTGEDAIQKLITSLRPLLTDKSLLRLGGDGDGGYLVPNDLDGVRACFSPGVGDFSTFELDCARMGMEVYLADGIVHGPAENHPDFHFTRKYIRAVSSPTSMTLDDWVNDTPTDPNQDLLLQMDIEGGEYEVFLSMSRMLLQRFRILVVEFHMLDQLWSRPFFMLASRAFQKILQSHACVHLHPNNCCGTIEKGSLDIPRVMEFTFLRRDRILTARPATQFPNSLDKDNTDNATLELPKCWYRRDQAESSLP